MTKQNDTRAICKTDRPDDFYMIRVEDLGTAPYSDRTLVVQLVGKPGPVKRSSFGAAFRVWSDVQGRTWNVFVSDWSAQEVR